MSDRGSLRGRIAQLEVELTRRREDVQALKAKVAELEREARSQAAPRLPSGAGGTMSEWQPIETAPKERGVLLLVYAPDPPRMMVWDAAILATAMRSDTPSHLRFAATHWMPLPEPPAHPGQEER